MPISPGWKIAGRVDGDILAGGAIEKLTIGSGLFTGGPALSVDGRIGTGSASHGISVSFDGGTTLLTTAFTPLDGAAGPNISNLRLHNGARAVIAGDGADVATGKAPAGGTIINLIMYNSRRRG